MRPAPLFGITTPMLTVEVLHKPDDRRLDLCDRRAHRSVHQGAADGGLLVAAPAVFAPVEASGQRGAHNVFDGRKHRVPPQK
jgi:hypothetical protein